jgi:hypothetical protein
VSTQPREQRDRAHDAHLATVTRSLRWADASAACGDYADALRWIHVVEASGHRLSDEYENKRQAWSSALVVEKASGWSIKPTEPTSDPSRAMRYLNCPRCGLTIRPKVLWIARRHCPRCQARGGTLVELFSSRLPAAALYADDSLPRANGANGRKPRSGAR